MWFIVIYVTFPNEENANKICNELLIEKKIGI